MRGDVFWSAEKVDRAALWRRQWRPGRMAAGAVDDHDGRSRAHRLRQIVSRGFTRARSNSCGGPWRARPANRRRGRGPGVGDLSPGRPRVPLQAIAGLLGVPYGGLRQAVDLSNKMIGGDDPEFADTSADRSGEVMWFPCSCGRARPRAGAERYIVTTLIDADPTARLPRPSSACSWSRCLAGNETTRNSITQGMAFTDYPDRWELFKAQRPKTAADEIIRWATRSRRFSAPLWSTPTRRCAGWRRASGWCCSIARRLRRRGLRRPVTSTSCAAPTRTSDSGARRALLDRRQPRPYDDRPDVPRDRRRSCPTLPPAIPSGCRRFINGINTGTSTTGGRARGQPRRANSVNKGRSFAGSRAF